MKPNFSHCCAPSLRAKTVFGVLLGLLVMTGAGGCESLQRKFTRVPKTGRDKAKGGPRGN